MIAKSTLLAFVALLVLAKSGQGPEIEHGPNELQGVWEIVKVVRGGVPDTLPAGMTLSFIGNEIHFQTTSPLNIITGKRLPNFSDSNRRIPS
jgi:hypothetical protein